MSLTKRAGSDHWQIDIRHAGRRIRQSSGTADRAAAQAEHNRLQVELWTQVPVTGEHTWGEAVDLWVDARERSSQELQSLAKFGRNFPDRALSAIKAEDVVKALSFVVAVSTYARYRAMILSILNMARKAEWLDKVPDLPVRKERKKKTRTWLTHEQWERLRAELPPHMRAMATFAVETGLRQSNVLNLRWAQVSLARRLVWIEADEMKGNVAHNVPLNDTALEILTSLQDQHPEFVFTYERLGKRGPVTEVKTAFSKACVRAGLGTVSKTVDTEGKTHREYQGFTWHGFRHTWATWHVQNGTPLDVLQKLGGWASYSMVLVYAHHAPGYLATFAGNTRKEA